MANSKYEYVKFFEQQDTLLPNTWIVVRIDGRSFHKLSSLYKFKKPNDRRALDLMNESARAVIQALPDLMAGYGVSDEFSFVFHKSCNLFERRASKLLTTVVSTFTAHYIHLWPTYFPSTPLSASNLPTFDGRTVQYPSIQNLRDYLSWRQADCHINNLYNTTFWAMVEKGGMSATDAEEELKGTLSADKNEILFSRFGINYNNELEIYRKGSVVFREYELATLDPKLQDPAQALKEGADAEEYSNEVGAIEPISRTQLQKRRKSKAKAKIVVQHIDIIKDDFWERRPWILSGKPGKLVAE